jgi:hypothetical protein
LDYLKGHMGHRSIQMTVEVYGHRLKKRNREAAERLGSAFFGPNGFKMGANGA